MIDSTKLSDEQNEIVEQYKKVHTRLLFLEDKMSNLSAEADKLIEELTALRELDKNILKNDGKK